MMRVSIRFFIAMLTVCVALTGLHLRPAHASEPANASAQEQDPSTEEVKLFESQGANGDKFGNAVAYAGDGSTAVIGTWRRNEPFEASGTAYVYTRDVEGWRFRTKLSISDPDAYDLLGISVAISYDGRTVIVGASSKRTTSPPASGVGAAYVFIRNGNTWVQQAKLLASDRSGQSYFGYSVSLSSDGNVALIGKYGATNGAYNGGAYVFTRSGTTWTEQIKLTPSDGVIDDGFGYAVSISADGRRTLVGAPFRSDSPLISNGAGYIFVRTGGTWTQQTKLARSIINTYAYFGWSVALSGDGLTALVGAPGDKGPAGSIVGAASIFNLSNETWTEATRLLMPDRAVNDWGGNSVSISYDGRTVLVGAPQRDEGGYTDVGAAYVFKRPADTWNFQRKLLSSNTNVVSPYAKAFGTSVSLSANGALAMIGAPESDTDSWAAIGVVFAFAGAQPTRVDTVAAYKSGTFYFRYANSAGAANLTVAFGGDASDFPVAGDWNGDKVDSIGIYRSNSGVFYLSNSNITPVTNYSLTFGNPGDRPFAGRWLPTMNSDGVGVYRNSNGILYQKVALTTGFSDFFAVFGNPGDQPVAGDWNNDGNDSIGIYRSSNQTWFLTNNSVPSGVTFSDVSFTWNIGTGVPVAGDWDGASGSTVGFLSNSGAFALRSANAASASDNVFAFGPTGSRPIAGKWGFQSADPAPIQPAPLTGVLVPSGQGSAYSDGNTGDGSGD
jgi:hypothetical protein